MNGEFNHPKPSRHLMDTVEIWNEIDILTRGSDEDGMKEERLTEKGTKRINDLVSVLSDRYHRPSIVICPHCGSDSATDDYDPSDDATTKTTLCCQDCDEEFVVNAERVIMSIRKLPF